MGSGFLKKKIILSAAFALVTATIGIAVFLHPGDKIATGVSVMSTYVGNMSRDEARQMLISANAKVPESIYIYTEKGLGTEFQSGEISLEYDLEKTIDAAFGKGRNGNFVENISELFMLRISPDDLGYICSYDKESLSGIIYNFGVSVNGEHKHYYLEYEEESVIVKRGRAGQSRDVSGAIYDFESAIGKGCDRIFVKLKRETVSMANLKNLYDETYIEPQNATYEIVDGRVVMMPEVVGRKIDTVEAANEIAALRHGDAVRLRLYKLVPEVTTEELNKKLFNHTLAQYTTSYSLGDKGRSANVALAAKKINGVVLAPGEVFSFNKVVGPRTTAAGFKSAPVFENGETVQGMGGGVCQVSSTLYSAALYADLDIVSRRNHSMTVAYVPKGQDATVSYGAIDFKFKNSTAYPIKIIASAVGGKMTVSICGTMPEVEKTVRVVNNIVSEAAPTVEEVPDESLPLGTRKVISAGKTGYTVASSRIVLEGGNEVKNEKLGTSVYKMVPARVTIGAKIPEPTPEPTLETVDVPEQEEIAEDTQPENLSGDENS